MEAEGQPEWIEEIIADEDVPAIESPHVAQLRNSKGGPYYVTPGSAEPLPSGIWADLDPDTLDHEANLISDLLESGEWQMGALDPELRAFLLADGAVGRKLIEILGGDSEE